MRNDIAFIEAAYGAMRLGAYGVPVNWHFKPEEINYILRDSGTSVLIGHADLLHQLREAIPPGVTVLSVSTPPEILSTYKIDRDHLATPDFAIDFEPWLAQQAPYDGPVVPQPSNMIYTSGTTGNPKGVRRDAPTPEQSAAAERMRGMIYGLKPGARALLPGPLYHSAPNSFGLRAGPARRRAGDHAAIRAGGIPAPDRARADRHHLHGADHVHPPDEAAGRRPQEIRRVVAAPRHPRRGTLSARRQARHDRVVGTDHLRILRLDRVGRGDLRQFRGRAEEARHRRQDLARRGAAFRRRRRPRAAAGRDRRNLFADRGQSRFHLSQQAGEARRDRARRFHHLGRRRLHRRRRLCLHLRSQARHGDLGRRQHLSRRDRIRPAGGARRARLRGVRHSRCGIRRGADGGGGTGSRRDAGCRRTSAPG